MIYSVTESNDNMFDGMNLAEACTELQVSVNNIINEMNMDILLNEHKYLYENGVEIEYIDEAGNTNDEGQKVKKSIGERISSVGRAIANLWNKIIDWITEHFNAVRVAFAKVGINRTKFEAALNDAATFYMTTTVPEGKYVDNDDWKNFEREVTTQMGFNTGSYIDSGDGAIDPHLANKYIKTRKETKVDVKDVAIAKGLIFDTKNIMKSVKEAKKAADKSLNDLKKQLQHDDGDDISSKLEMVNNGLKYNSNIVRDAAKVYHAYVLGNVTIARAFLKQYKKEKSANNKLDKKIDTDRKDRENARNNAEKMHESSIFSGKYFSV